MVSKIITLFFIIYLLYFLLIFSLFQHSKLRAISTYVVISDFLLGGDLKIGPLASVLLRTGDQCQECCPGG